MRDSKLQGALTGEENEEENHTKASRASMGDLCSIVSTGVLLLPIIHQRQTILDPQQHQYGRHERFATFNFDSFDSLTKNKDKINSQNFLFPITPKLYQR
jgi:hypothetical protein